MISRRVVAVGMSAYGLLSLSQRTSAAGPARVYRIGVLASGTELPGDIEAFISELAAQGYVEGKTVVYVRRMNPERQSAVDYASARELVAMGVDIIFAVGGSRTAVAAKAATTKIPIVFSHSSDPVTLGLVESLAHPGGNATGSSDSAIDIAGAAMALLIEAVGKPSLFIGDIQPRGITTWPLFNEVDQAVRAVVKKLGARYEYVDVDSVDEIEPALMRFVSQGVGAVILSPYPMFRPRLPEIAALLIKYRLPSLGRSDVGFLMEYIPDYSKFPRRAAEYVDKILKGAPPSSLPVEQPRAFTLSINLNTAKAINLVLPKSLLLRADRLIQ